ncbi:hypothetical protein AAG570_005213 [Ranatra chinensis]|uniref:Uncharacterized protein n=1 Tax=Ranatra chinensis TaxID=642074 RepID=A0ABD0XZV2_9HEMI
MYHVMRGKFGLVPVVGDCGGCHRKRLLRDVVAALTLRGRHFSLQSGGQRHPHRQRRLLSPPGATLPHQTRGMAMLVARILKGALKIRYLILGGAVGGGVTLQKTVVTTKFAEGELVCCFSVYIPVQFIVKVDT